MSGRAAASCILFRVGARRDADPGSKNPRRAIGSGARPHEDRESISRRGPCGPAFVCAAPFAGNPRVRSKEDYGGVLRNAQEQRIFAPATVAIVREMARPESAPTQITGRKVESEGIYGIPSNSGALRAAPIVKSERLARLRDLVATLLRSARFGNAYGDGVSQRCFRRLRSRRIGGRSCARRHCLCGWLGVRGLGFR